MLSVEQAAKHVGACFCSVVIQRSFVPVKLNMMHNLWTTEDNVISTNEQCGLCTKCSLAQLKHSPL
jgi:hypothetical protein